jgi:hypothetical protein
MIQRFRLGVLAPCVVALSAILFSACSGDEATDSGADSSTSDMSVTPTTDSGSSVTEPVGSSIATVEEVTVMGEITDEFLASAPLAEGECGSVAAEAGATRLTNGSLPEFETWATSIENGEIEPPAADPNEPEIGDLSSYGAYKFDFTVLARGDLDGDGSQDALARVSCQHGGWAGKYPLSIYLSSRISPFELSDCYFGLFDTWMYAEFQQSNIPTPDISGNTYPDNGPMFHVRHQSEAWDYLTTLEFRDSSGVAQFSSVESCEISWNPSVDDIEVATYGWGG